MSKPTIKSGKLVTGENCTFGEGVIIDVAEEVVLGDRVTVGDNAYLCGRRITLDSDTYVYSHWNRRLEVGLGRIDEEDAVLTVGKRSTLHDNRIDLARRVTLGDDVGLSPEVVAYTHGYWLSPLDGYPMAHEPVTVESGVIVGFRSVLLPGSSVGANAVIGAQSVVSGALEGGRVYGGSPARLIRVIVGCTPAEKKRRAEAILGEYRKSLDYRGIDAPWGEFPGYPYSLVGPQLCSFDLGELTFEGEEDEHTDDFREHCFKRGIRFFSKRPFRKLGRRT